MEGLTMKSKKAGKAEILAIVNKYVKGNAQLVATNPSPQAFNFAAAQAREGKRKLKALNLSAEDSKHISLLYAAFTNLNLALKAAARRDFAEHFKRMHKAVSLADDYERRGDS